MTSRQNPIAHTNHTRSTMNTEETTPWTPTELRKGDLAQMREALQDQSTRRRDLVIEASALTMTDDGDLQVLVVTHDVTLEGVTQVVTTKPLQLLDVADGHLAERLSIPRAYYRRMKDGYQQLLAANVNTWLAADQRSVTLRTFTRDEAPDLLRAVLSDRYAIIDSWDAILAVLAGLRDSGLDTSAIEFDGDLTERRMRLRITAPQVGVNVADLLEDYKSPFTGESARELPMMWAGLEISNSETGGGAFTITPRAVLQVCRNGMTMRQDLHRAVHLGGRMESGTIEWSEDTQQKTLELVTARTRDAVTTFLSEDYLTKVADNLRKIQGIEVPHTAKVLEAVGKALTMNEDEQDQLLNAFIKSGDTTVLGVGHAVTAIAQGAPDPERAAELEGSFIVATTVAQALVAAS
jgi:hypothetical protein